MRTAFMIPPLTDPSVSENPYRAPQSVELPKQSVWAATRRGAKIGAMIGAFPIVALQALRLTVIGYFAVVDPDRARYIVDDLTPTKMFTDFVYALFTTTPIGAAGGAAWLAARAWGRLKQGKRDSAR